MQNVKNSFEEILDRVMGIHIEHEPPRVKSELFPIENPPTVMLYFGVLAESAVSAVREQLPAECMLCWLCSPDETDDSIHHVQQRCLIAKERTVIIKTGDDGAFERNIEQVLMLQAECNVRYVVVDGFREKYSLIAERVALAVKRTLENRSMDAGRGLIFLRSSLMNLSVVSRSYVAALPSVPAGIDAIICAAGPSLRNQLGMLSEIQHRVLLICVGHALPALLRAGISPDIVVEDDAVAGINWDADITPAEDMVLVAATTVDRRVSKRFKRIVWCRGSSPVFNDRLEYEGISLANMTLYKTISTHAIEVALRMGCSRIALVGQDLSLGPSGMLHADEKRAVSSAEKLVELAANEGGTVLATQDLAVLHRAVEEYLELLHRVIPDAVMRPRIINCTEGGALLRNTDRMSLAEFSETLPEQKDVPPFLVQELPKADHVREKIQQELKQYVLLTDAIIGSSRILAREAERYPVRMDRIKEQQKELQRAVEAEKQWLQENNGKLFWIRPLLEQADRIARSTPGLLSDNEDAHHQLYFLQSHYRLLRDMTADLLADIIGTAKSQAQEARRPEVFDSFLALGTRVIRQNNKPFADWLEQHGRTAGNSDVLQRFRFHWKNQMFAGMDVKDMNDAGQWVSVAGEWSMLEDARQEVRAFLQDQQFDPANDGIVILAPCNWIHVFQFLEYGSPLRLIVVEPWIEALAVQMLHGCFVHRIPRDALILGADSRIKKWEKAYRERVKIWQRAGHRILFFTPARICSQPDVLALKNQLAF